MAVEAQHTDGDDGPRAPCDEGQEEFCRFVAIAVGQAQRLAFNKTEAAESLGVSVEFFDRYVVPEVRSIRLGRRRLYPLWELLCWLWRSSDRRSERTS